MKQMIAGVGVAVLAMGGSLSLSTAPAVAAVDPVPMMAGDGDAFAAIAEQRLAERHTPGQQAQEDSSAGVFDVAQRRARQGRQRYRHRQRARRGHVRRHRGHVGTRHHRYRHRPYRHRPYRARGRYYSDGAAVAAGVIGFAAGALAAGAIAAPQTTVVVPSGTPAPYTGEWYRQCDLKYRSFRASDGTFLGYDGIRKVCRLP